MKAGKESLLARLGREIGVLCFEGPESVSTDAVFFEDTCGNRLECVCRTPGCKPRLSGGARVGKAISIVHVTLRLKATFAMVTILMQSKATTVQQYIEELPVHRRSAIEGLRAVILKNLDPTFEEGMQYGMIGYYVPHRVYPPGYHCDPRQPLPFICLASQKNYMSVYLGCVYGPEREQPFREAWAKTGKKLDMGKSCVRFRKLDGLALDLIGESIRLMSARGFIEYYELAIKTMLRKTSRSAAGKRSTTKTSTTKPAHAKRRK